MQDDYLHLSLYFPDSWQYPVQVDPSFLPSMIIKQDNHIMSPTPNGLYILGRGVIITGDNDALLTPTRKPGPSSPEGGITIQ